MSFYEDLQLVSDSLITEFGLDASLIKKTSTSYDPTVSGVVTEALTTVTVKAFLFPFDLKSIDGTVVRSTDSRAYISPISTNLEIAQGDHLVVNGVTYAIVAARPLKPAAVNVLWIVQLRA